MLSATVSKAFVAGNVRVQQRQQRTKVVVAAYEPEKRQSKAAAALAGLLSSAALLAGTPDAQALGNPNDYPGAPSTPEQAVQELKDAGKQIKSKVDKVRGDDNTDGNLYTGEKIFKKVEDIKDGVKGGADRAGQSAASNIKGGAERLGASGALDAAKSGAGKAKDALDNANPLDGIGNPIDAVKSAVRGAKDAASDAADSAKSLGGDLGSKAKGAAGAVSDIGGSKGARDIRSPNVKPSRPGNDLAGQSFGSGFGTRSGVGGADGFKLREPDNTGRGLGKQGGGKDLAENTADALSQAKDSAKAAFKKL